MMGNKAEEELYLINRGAYLHIVDNITHIDYTIYDKETMRQLFHDQLDMSTVCEQPAMGIFNAARYAVAEDYGIYIVTVENVPLNMLQTLRSAQRDPSLDEYPRPDNLYYMTHMACMGYLKGDLLPVSDDASVALSQQGFTIYEVTSYGKLKPPAEVNTPGTKLFSSIFAISRREWEASPAFYEAVEDRMNHQKEREMAFLCQTQNCFAIQRGLTTSSTAIFVPFTTQELFMSGEALYYGLNALSNNLIMADRKKLKKGNGPAPLPLLFSKGALIYHMNVVCAVLQTAFCASRHKRTGEALVHIQYASDTFCTSHSIAKTTCGLGPEKRR